MADEKLRAWWSYRQGLEGSLAGRSAVEVLEATGWARSVGGSSPYLTLFARAGIRRAEADKAAASLEIHELPSARGCTYVLPASDYALALAVAEPFGHAEMNVARKLGVTDEEIDCLSEAVVGALAKEVLSPDEIRNAVGPAARSLGPEGVKKGITTTLPLALGRLQVEGKIRRVPVNGRLDQQRYNYAIWKPNPLAKGALDKDGAFTELARRYFRWAGGATLAEFQWFSGLGVKAAKAAVEPLKLEAVSHGCLLLPEDRAAFESFRIPGQPQYSLVSSLDGITQLRRNAQSVLLDEDRIRRLPPSDRPISDLPDHGIMDRGRLVGFWQFDPAIGQIVWLAFITPDKALRDCVAKTEAFIREDLEDFRSFSLDSPKSRIPRIKAIREGVIA